MDALHRTAVLAYPYERLEPAARLAALRSLGREPGSAIVWWMTGGEDDARYHALRTRPGGVSLLVILPPEPKAIWGTAQLQLHRLRPHGMLPFQSDPATVDLCQVLRRPPLDMSGEFVDYLRWRGATLDQDTAHLVRRILDLSHELKSVSAVSRSLYLSRRALGRRLTTRGLPVPSHWLQIGRLIRTAVTLQNNDSTVASVAFEHGYPDGFSLSNQMERLTGHRPSEVRGRLGWEWLVEAWLRREAEAGRFTAATVMRSQRRADDAPRTWLGSRVIRTKMREKPKDSPT